MRRVLYFEADYCGMCKAVRKRVIDGLIKQGLPVEVIDCMVKPSLAERHGVKKLPTTIVIDHDGEPYATFQGVCPPGNIGEWLEERE